MSEELRTEEEQVEAMKKWWNENGKSLIITVVVVLAGYFGWNSYQENQRVQGEAAASIYQVDPAEVKIRQFQTWSCLAA